MTTRWFAALRPSSEAVRHLAALVADLALPRPTAGDDWHVTLAFCGELGQREVTAASRAIAIASAEAPAMRLRLADTGTFNNDAVIFAGLGGEVPKLRRLAARLREELDHVGVDYASQPFHPHLTLARPRRAGVITHAQRIRLREYSGPEWNADVVRLYRTASGVRTRYETVARFRLDG